MLKRLITLFSISLIFSPSFALPVSRYFNKKKIFAKNLFEFNSVGSSCSLSLISSFILPLSTKSLEF